MVYHCHDKMSSFSHPGMRFFKHSANKKNHPSLDLCDMNDSCDAQPSLQRVGQEETICVFQCSHIVPNNVASW